MTNLRGYSLVTLAYWGFTLTDGALRMLVLLHFHELGFSPVQLAFLFLLYEFCGVITNLMGGWLGTKFGLRLPLYLGLTIQVVSLLLLAFLNQEAARWFSVGYVMAAQALSGVAKDLTKMSSKSAVKLLAPKKGSEGEKESGLFRWVALLTGSKNTLKGVGFFLGGLLLASFGFQVSLFVMAGFLVLILLAVGFGIREEIGRPQPKVKFSGIFSKNREINLLSVARFFLFASRDIWFVVALPVFLSEALGWSFTQVGGFLAAWVIGYGIVQASVPLLSRRREHFGAASAMSQSRFWLGMLFLVTGGIACSAIFDYRIALIVLGGLILFGVVFAVNSSLHSYLILALSESERVALNVGFYYMANALGRLVGSLLSGLLFLWLGLPGCLGGSALFVLAALLVTCLVRMSPMKVAVA